ncbi:Hypothetical protein CFV354_1603 [Campylobacter fetus subsp. venerealis NCTC 10354]|nr:Hypothetical protein CFV354_1603 [Campylobacter fetus subsp. venerealis NCTC 10354]
MFVNLKIVYLASFYQILATIVVAIFKDKNGRKYFQFKSRYRRYRR